MKVCCCCKAEKPISDFYKDKRTPDGLYTKCKQCHCAATKKWSSANKDVLASAARARRAKDPEKHRSYHRKYQALAYKENPDKFRAISATNRRKDPDKANAVVRASRAKNPDYMPAYLARYYAENKERIKHNVREREKRLGDSLKPINAEKAMRRLARKRFATPCWADVEEIRSFYILAANKTKETGLPHQVDHIVPLQSKKVCGLHVAANLRVITASENQSKSNRFWPDSP